MQIGIFETGHFEGAYPVIRLFDNGQNDIVIFTYAESYRQFQYLFKDDMHRLQWVVREEGESKYHFIYRMYKETRKRKIGLLYMNTVTDNFIFYAAMINLLRKVRISVTLHDINTYFALKPAFSLRRMVRYAGKRWLVKSVQEFNVVSETMVDYLQNKLPSFKKVHNLPGAVFDPAQYQDHAPPVTGHIKIVVPGSVDPRRRNYQMVFELLEAGRHLPLSIVLLGAFADPYGKEIREKCRQYASSHQNLSFYEATGVVDQPEFDRVMNEAHMAFIPSVINTIIADGMTETYGLSISSGNIFDIIKHAKPFIAPTTLNIPDRLASSAISYDTVTDIVNFLESLLQEPARYQDLLQKALSNSGEYTIEKVRARNPTLFDLAS